MAWTAQQLQGKCLTAEQRECLMTNMAGICADMRTAEVLLCVSPVLVDPTLDNVGFLLLQLLRKHCSFHQILNLANMVHQSSRLYQFVKKSDQWTLVQFYKVLIETKSGHLASLFALLLPKTEEVKEEKIDICPICHFLWQSQQPNDPRSVTRRF